MDSLDSNKNSSDFSKHVFRPLALAISMAFTGALSLNAQAATYTVSNTLDSGAGSLRQAIIDSNGNSGPDNIIFSVVSGSIISLNSELDITDSVTITGPSPGDQGSIILNAGGNSRHIRANDFYTQTKSLTLENITLSNGDSSFGSYAGSGGAIYTHNINLILNHCLITGNSTSDNYANGGGIHVFGNAIITSSNVSSNSTTGNRSHGGGLYVSGDTTLVLSTVTGNSTATDYSNGGGIHGHGTVTLTQSVIKDNTTAGSYIKGGGLHGFGDVILNQSDISNNSMTGKFSSGGGLWVGNTTIVNNSTIKDNSISVTSGTATGGGLYASSGVTLSFSTVTGNTLKAPDSVTGGGLVSFNGPNTLIHSDVSNNSMIGAHTSRGGGLSISEGPTTIIDSTISNNTVSGRFIFGAGAQINGVSTITRSTISNNSSTGDSANGGGLYNHDGAMTLNQCTVSGNTTTGNYDAGGGGIFVYGQLTVNQSTIVNNSSTSEAGGVSVTYGYNHIFSNSILSGNSGPKDNLYVRQTSSNSDNVLMTNSLFGDSASEITNPASFNNQLSNIPDLGPLQDNGGLTLTHLPNLTSVTINNGSNVEASAFATDQRGTGFPRIAHGRVDIGSVELSLPSNQGDVVTRSEIVKPILLAVLGDSFIPDTAIGTLYTDVATNDFNADWIEKFKADGYTEGCELDRFCPKDVVTKEQLAKFIIKAKQGSGYTPMPATGIYTDVPMGSFNADWIEALNMGGMTMGCATGKFCPKDVVTVEIFENILNAAFP